MKQLSFSLAILLLLSACSSAYKAPKEPFEGFPTPTALDYSSLDNWSASPLKKDFADTIPETVGGESQDTAKVDVFFIHPTTYVGGKTWNDDLKQEKYIKATDQRAIKHQASVFNHVCRVYAPRYQQMVYSGFFAKDTLSRNKALAIAYRDVRTAFRYYLQHHNQGRPFILASHSQGSLHAIRLIRDEIDGQDLQKQLVAAYLVGWPVSSDTSFAVLQPCTQSDETGCYVTWNCYLRNHYPKYYDPYFKGAHVTNPISWRSDTLLAPKSSHKGLLWANYKKIYPNLVNAQAHEGILWVSRPLFFIRRKDYHVADYNLFWLDIRANVAERVEAYLEKF